MLHYFLSLGPLGCKLSLDQGLFATPEGTVVRHTLAGGTDRHQDHTKH